MKRHLAIVSIFLIVLFPLFSRGLESFSGYLLRDKTGTTSFHSYDHNKTYSLQAGSLEVVQQLKKLDSFDSIRGTGVLNSKNLTLQSIDFVGLRRLIGEWRGKSMVVQFHSYVDVSLFPFPATLNATRGNYKYALTPGNGDQWKLFFTDQSQVALATLVLVNSSQAVLTFYNSQTGEAVQTLPMTKTHK